MPVDDGGQVRGRIDRAPSTEVIRSPVRSPTWPAGVSGSTWRTTAPAGPPKGSVGDGDADERGVAEVDRGRRGAGSIWIGDGHRPVDRDREALAAGDAAHPVGQRRGDIDADHLPGVVDQWATGSPGRMSAPPGSGRTTRARAAPDSSDARTDAPSSVTVPGA